MKQLLYKEFRLASHPAAILFLALSTMMLIPNYPLTVTFFYPCLGAFFICLNSRENRDLAYTLLLPVKKRDLVRARVLMVAVLQLCQLVLCVPFFFLRSLSPPVGNVVGLDANLALLGFGLVEFGIFNLVFFPWHYRDLAKVGVPFLVGSIAVFVWVGISEAAAHTVPFVRDRLDTPLFAFLPEKAAALLIGAALYALLTVLAVRIAERRFERLDVQM